MARCGPSTGSTATPSQRLAAEYRRPVDLAAYLGTVAGLCGLSVGAMYVIVGLLGRRIDDVGVRVAHIEAQNDTILGAVCDWASASPD